MDYLSDAIASNLLCSKRIFHENSYTHTFTHTDQSINSVYLLSHNSVVRDHLSPFEIITKENGNVLHDRTKMYAYIKCDEKKERKKERRMENKIRRTSEVSVYFSRATL